MKKINFAKRNIKELLRDPVSLIFCVFLPLFLLVIFQQFQIPSDQYRLENFTPGIIVFSFSFITLFTAQLIAKDRSTSFLSRLFSSPMKPNDYIIGYMLALLPIAIVQSILFFVVALVLGLSFSVNIIYTILVLIPISLLFIGLGILLGTFSSEKQAPALGSLVVQFVAFTSGMWFAMDQVSKGFGAICKALPFKYVLDLARMVLNNNYSNTLLTVVIIIVYIILVIVIASIIFKKKMISDNK